MVNKILTAEELKGMIGEPLYGVWEQLTACIEERYETDRLWGGGGRAWKCEYKYRRGGKTLCSLFAREDCIGFMIVFGKEERAQFEEERAGFSKETQTVYDSVPTYHDGKWMMFEPQDASLFEDFMHLLRIKRKPNKK